MNVPDLPHLHAMTTCDTSKACLGQHLEHWVASTHAKERSGNALAKPRRDGSGGTKK
jgi:hypothetical protein